MNPIFSILSIGYIAGIFLLADSPIVSDVATFNPYSFLHIPMYGILTLFLILSFSRSGRKLSNPTNSMNSITPRNLSREMRPAPCTVLTTTSGSLFHWDPTNYLVAGLVALVVAIADEIHQAYLPTRNPSIIDVFLDIIGIILCVALIRQLERKSRFSNIMMQMSRMTKKRDQP